MAEQSDMEVSGSAATNAEVLEFGGLRFEVSFRDIGATLRVDGRVDGTWTELLRFDDFVEMPHFHAPADADATLFDRALGEPLAWYVAQIRDHLSEWLERSGFGEVLETIDLDAIAANSDRLTEAMTACVPAGFVRIPGVGLSRSDRVA